MLSTLFVPLLIAVTFGEDTMVAPVKSTDNPCDDPQFADTDVCQAKAQNATCTGPKCWSCEAPLQETQCVKSSWIKWKSQEEKFAAECSGELVRFGVDSGVKDCGVACFGCSYIKACCDTCTSVLKTVGQWAMISCTDVEVDVKYSYGVQTTSTSSWSRTETWSQSVSLHADGHGVVMGIAGEISLDASAAHSLVEKSESSWSVTTTKNTSVAFTQPAKTCSWHWRTTITDSCGVRTADSKDFILTSGPMRGAAPCCLPGFEQDDTGNCAPDNAGNVINLCPPKSTSEALIKRLSA